MLETTPKTAAQEWRDNWTLVLASSFGFSFFSIMLAAAGLFVVPLGKEFGWTKTVLSAGPSLAMVTTALLGPVFGMLVDRYGSRRLVLPGLIANIAVISAFAALNGATWQWYLLWVGFGIISVSIKSTAWTAATVGVFRQSRGLALGLTLSGAALSGMIIPPLSVWLIGTVGWRLGFVWLALGWGGITFALCYFFFFDIHDRRMRGSARAAQPSAAEAGVVPAAEILGLTRREGLLNTALWRLALSNFLIMMLTQGLTFHLFMILTEAGVAQSNAALLMSLAAFAGIVGKLVTGLLLDRFPPNWVGGITLGAAALAFLLLIDGIRSPAIVIVAMIVNGYAFGTKTQITGNLTASYAGMKSFGFLYGIMAALMSLAAGLGPLAAAYSYDHLGGYGPFLLAGTVGCVLSGLMMISLPSYPEFDRKS